MKVFLVHGVGEQKPGLIEQSVEQVAEAQGISSIDVEEVNWNEAVTQALAASGIWSKRLELSKIADVSRGMVGAAHIELPGSDAARAARRGILLALQVALILLFVSPWIPTGAYLETLGLSCLVAGSLGLLHWVVTAATFPRAGLPPQLDTGAERLIAALRPALMLLLWPLASAGFLLFTWIGFWLPVSIAVAFIGYLLLAASGEIQPALGPDGELIIQSGTQWGILGPLLIVAVLVGFSLALIGWTGIRVVLKVLGDVVIYLGDPVYRDAVQNHVAGRIASRLEPRDRLLLVTHSLGTAIVSDCFRNGKLDALKGHDVTLVTMGSPLERLMARFFSEVYTHPDETARELRQRFGSLFWLNVYRPKDPVGAGLFTRDTPYCKDRSTAQPLGWIKAHVDYWGDDLVASIVREELAEQAKP